MNKSSKTFFDLASLSTKGTVYPQVPKLLFEIILFGGAVGTITFVLLKNENSNMNSWIEIMSLYLISAYRLLPYLDGFFQALSKINLNIAAVNMISQHLMDAENIDLEKNQPKRLNLKKI